MSRRGEPSRASIRAANIAGLALLVVAGGVAAAVWLGSPEGIGAAVGDQGAGGWLVALSYAAGGDFTASREVWAAGPIAWIGLLSSAALGAVVLLMNVLRFGVNRPEVRRWEPPGEGGGGAKK